MENNFKIADISDDALKKIQELENQINNSSEDEIVLIAYSQQTGH